MDTNEESLIRAAEQDDDLQYGNDVSVGAHFTAPGCDDLASGVYL